MKLLCREHPNTELTLTRTAQGRWDISGLACRCIAEQAAEHIRRTAAEDRS